MEITAAERTCSTSCRRFLLFGPMMGDPWGYGNVRSRARPRACPAGSFGRDVREVYTEIVVQARDLEGRRESGRGLGGRDVGGGMEGLNSNLYHPVGSASVLRHSVSLSGPPPQN